MTDSLNGMYYRYIIIIFNICSSLLFCFSVFQCSLRYALLLTLTVGKTLQPIHYLCNACCHSPRRSETGKRSMVIRVFICQSFMYSSMLKTKGVCPKLASTTSPGVCSPTVGYRLGCKYSLQSKAFDHMPHVPHTEKAFESMSRWNKMEKPTTKKKTLAW